MAYTIKNKECMNLLHCSDMNINVLIYKHRSEKKEISYQIVSKNNRRNEVRKPSYSKEKNKISYLLFMVV